MDGRVAGRPMRAVVALMPALMAALAGGGCDGRTPVDADDGVPAPASSPAAVVLTDKSIYAAGEPIVMTLSVTNTSDREITLQFSSGQRYDFTIQDPTGNVVWRWSDGRAFTMALGSETLKPGEALRYEERFSGQLDPAAYRVTGTLTVTGDPISATATITVR